MIAKHFPVFLISIIVFAGPAFSNDHQNHDKFVVKSDSGDAKTNTKQEYYAVCAGSGKGMEVWTGSSYRNLVVGGLWGVDLQNMGRDSNLKPSMWIDATAFRISNSSAEKKVEVSASIHSMVTSEHPRFSIGGGISLQLNYHDASYHWTEDQREISFLLAPGFYSRIGSLRNNFEVGINSRTHLVPGPLSLHLNFSLLGVRFGYMTFYANMKNKGVSDDWAIPGGLFIETMNLKLSNFVVRPLVGLNLSGTPPGLFLNLYFNGR